ncbi:hypothetical protein DL768_002793 [Monosporascus sp. mg162]|nr:hypothetical protein DL768_002793 [Monosporascus sp. mg162]
MASKITDWVKPGDNTGEFKRADSAFRDWISPEPGARFPPEKGRYHLKLKGLEDIISFSVVHWHMGEKGIATPSVINSDLGKRTDSAVLTPPLGWRFPTPEDQDAPGENVVPDPLPGHEGYTHLRDVYFAVDPNYGGRFTVPVLFDRKLGTIVNNESSEILRMLGSAFDGLLPEEYARVKLYPEALRADIDEAAGWTYDRVNNGVYKSGFATTQDAYERNVVALFDALDRAEKHLAGSKGPYWFGDAITETDIRMYVTLIRFDPVYVQHFKCNIRDIRSGYPHLHKWLRNLYWNHPAFKETTNFVHIKRHYTKSHTQINPHGITPLGPVPDILPPDEEVPAVKAAL